MKRGEYSYLCCLYRMGEFYDYDQLDYYLRTIKDNNLDMNEGMQFLDMQTRTNTLQESRETPLLTVIY